MADIRMRFYGRFVFAEPAQSGALKVLAINPQYTEGISANKHDFLMSIPRCKVVPTDSMLLPDFKVMAGMPLNSRLVEHAVWRLAGRNVKPQTTPAAPPFSWVGDRGLLANVGQFGNSHLDSRHLAGGTSDLVKGLIDVPIGEGSPHLFLKGGTYTLQALGRDTDVAEVTNVALADVVEVQLKNVQTLTLQIVPTGGGDRSEIMVEARLEEPTVVSFSNLCTGAHSEVDEEFAAFYDVLDDPPPLKRRLVPVFPRPLDWATGTDCYPSAYVQY